MDDRPGLRDLSPRSLRALAHPLRLAILASLRDDGPATASNLAARLSESSGSTSYHLRQLAAHQFVVEDQQRGTAKERWWAAVDRETRLDHSLMHHPDPEVARAAVSLLRQLAMQHMQALDGWIRTESSWSEPWRESADLSDFQLRLTPARTQELVTALHALVRSYSHDDEVDAAQVRLQIQAFPRRAEQ
ncbi:winged helix-turn-helix domain-containing protein [Pseudonocardia alni]|jgi:DNA-binding transcriptional ArsR family regulator|uniref:DNA-binding transcriptional ArsR family regulator n=1 Tax=Pseudonocardia alni TaxID=33907 RepID=A0A852W8J1_PSEA5|nr:helix-turn-helix domain-containing protein [Pseudonocardia antarctica]NYG05398.1 DNA-binding transcriptional ArsR family regulator [Pseudonocardia antarctica]